MVRRLFRWSLALLLLAGIGLGVWLFSRPEPVGVVVKPVTRGIVERTVANTRAGTVKACRRAKLSPGIGGQIVRLPIREGETVKEGQLLLELWNADLVAQAQLATKELETARSRAQAACIQAQVARRDAERLVALKKSGSVSLERTDQAVAQAEAGEAECAASRAAVRSAEARVEVVRANLDRTRLTAPFDGVVAEINGELFEYVTPSPVGIPTPPAVDLVDNACFYVTAPIDEVDAAAIRMGMPVRITMDAFGDRRFAGRVRRIADYVLDVEKQARTVDVEVAFDDPEDRGQLLAGYSADIEVILDVRTDVLRVPTEAVMDGGRVFVFDPADRRLGERTIATGLANWDHTEVTAGVSAGEQVVVNVDLPDLADGSSARLAEEAP
jgi:HlyD family secretion protein